MNNTINSYHSKSNYHIILSRVQDHIVEGSFIIGPDQLKFGFTAIAEIVSPMVRAISFIIDWKGIQNDILEAQTAFTGYIKQNEDNPLISLDWLLIQRLRYSPDVQFTSSGKSLLCASHRPEHELQVTNSVCPFPKTDNTDQIRLITNETETSSIT